jgi:hypothetical protein
MKRKLKIKANPYTIIQNAIETAVPFAIRRTYKHRDDGLADDAIESLTENIGHEFWNALDQAGVEIK